MILEGGAELGRYLLMSRVGAGGMAEVWKALDQSLGRQVALKVISETYGTDPTYLQRFFREARITAQLEHGNILPIYDFGKVEGHVYIVMPLLTGGTLRERARGGVDLPTALGWLRSIASALDFAHSEGVVHRDVKPANVLFDRTGRVLLADFGIAKAERGGESLTVAGTIVGTPIYMSPEQLRGEELDGRSDQYALGVLAYYLLTGQPPFDANSMFLVMTKTLFEEPLLPSTLKPQLHRGVDYILLKAMEKDRASRFPTCARFVDALDRVLQGIERSRPGTL